MAFFVIDKIRINTLYVDAKFSFLFSFLLFGVKSVRLLSINARIILKRHYMKTKSLKKSRTLWWNVIGLSVLLLSAPEFADLKIVSPELIATLVALGNIALRFVTKTGLSVTTKHGE